MKRQVFRIADVLHLHLIHNKFFSLFALPRLARLKPTVWTIHDVWAVTGHCYYPLDCPRWLIGCGDCPDLARTIPLRSDTTARMWRIKQRIYRKLDIDLVVASKWMADRVAESPLLSHLRQHRIPHGVDTDVFRPTDRGAARERLGLPRDAYVLAFRAYRCSGDIKGFDWLADALPHCRPQGKCVLLALDSTSAADDLRARYRDVPRLEVRSLGWVREPDRMVDIYNASDLFLMPSRAEAFGMMAIEAMACGVPLVVGEGTALPDIIDAPHCGVAVRSGDVQALADAISSLLADEGRRSEMGRLGRERTVKEYCLSLHVQRHLALYQEAIERWRTTANRKGSQP